MEYAIDGAKLAKENGLYTVFVTNGYVDGYDASAVQNYEKEMFAYIESKYQYILDEIKDKKAISEDLAGKVRGALDELVQQLGEFK